MAETIEQTNFTLPGQVGPVYHGKVSDVYTIGQGEEELLAIVRTDRLSAYDVILPKLVPHKGQVVNEMAYNLLSETDEVAENWLIAMPDPNVTIGRKATRVDLEFIVRSHMVGNIWQKYNSGIRNFGTNRFPDHMHEFQQLPDERPLLTPTTKAPTGQKDREITEEAIIEEGFAEKDEYGRMSVIARGLFLRGQELAARHQLTLTDAKFEIGKLASGKLIVIDEAFTPDSARYYRTNELEDYLTRASFHRPTPLSKEFVRERLATSRFTGQANEVLPDITNEFLHEVSLVYTGLYETLLNKPFVASDHSNILSRIENNIHNYFENHAA